MFGWLRKVWILISLINCITNLWSIFVLSILLMATIKPVLICLKYYWRVPCNKDLTKFTRTHFFSQLEFINIERILVFLLTLVLGKWRLCRQTLLELWLVKKYHLKYLIVFLHRGFIQLVPRLLVRFVSVDHTTPVFVLIAGNLHIEGYIMKLLVFLWHFFVAWLHLGHWWYISGLFRSSGTLKNGFSLQLRIQTEWVLRFKLVTIKIGEGFLKFTLMVMLHTAAENENKLNNNPRNMTLFIYQLYVNFSHNSHYYFSITLNIKKFVPYDGLDLFDKI